MKKNIRNLAGTSLLVLLAMAGCGKEKSEGVNDTLKAYFDSWIGLNYPDARPWGNGIYLLEDVPGTGAAWTKEKGISRITYTVRGMDGVVSYNSDPAIARQIGDYDSTAYYGPQMIFTGEDLSYVGIDDLLEGMQVGGRRTAVLPPWLLTFSRYAQADEYLQHEGAAAGAIYTIRLDGQLDNLRENLYHELRAYADGWEALTVSSDPNVSVDTTLYLRRLHLPEGAEAIPADSTAYILYTGRLLVFDPAQQKLVTGRVFDANDEHTAKDWGVHSPSRTYGAAPVVLSETRSGVTLNGSNTIGGFAFGLQQLHYGEKAAIAFAYDLGYQESGKSPAIPPYAALLFEIEVLPKDE